MTNQPAIQLDAEAVSDQYKTRFPLLWIAATIAAGLLIAGIYLGARIVTAHLRTNQADARNAMLVKPPLMQPITPAKVEPKPPLPAIGGAPEEPIRMIKPKTGERYIQVGALNSEAARRFIERLHTGRLEAHVAPGPNLQLTRVLIGPFTNSDALRAQQTKLRSEGIECFVRKY
ncbi:MAG: SPOR domain-containing protein [Bryobacterales bacterium]|nr:SPOR domain-containing protein [Bryobacterales bacterium]